MKNISTSVRWYALIGGIGLVLAALAWLQYQSIRQISRASAGQILTTLQSALMDFRQGVERELTPLCQMFSEDTGLNRDVALAEIANRFREYEQTGAHPTLIAEVYVWRGADGNSPALMRMTRGAKQFEPATWPAETQPLQEKLAGFTKTISGPAIGLRSGRGATNGGAQAGGNEPPERAFSWQIDQRIPMLAYAVHERSANGAPSIDWILIELDKETLWGHIFPEIAQRTFSRGERGAEEFAFVDGSAKDALILSSDGQFGKSNTLEPDAVLNLFGMPQTLLKETRSTPARGTFATFVPERVVRIEPIRYANESADWAIMGKSGKGSVDAAVRGLYYRSLAINFGVLLVLTVAIGSLIVSTQRARQLSQMQMDFVANVSHELRTPLTGIYAAAQNIVDGVVQSRERTVSYGKAIMGQAGNLTELVEQILLFSATQKGRHRYHLESTQVRDVVQDALDRTAAVLKQRGTDVELKVAPDLPPVEIDAKAMAHCLQNLITNAVKYGGEQRWVGIRAGMTGADGNREVQIDVQDHGIGISAEQAKLIFDPFYRTPEATAAQIHGSGLGLALAKSITESMGGRLTVNSAPNEGSTFTVHLPVAKG